MSSSTSRLLLTVILLCSIPIQPICNHDEPEPIFSADRYFAFIKVHAVEDSLVELIQSMITKEGVERVIVAGEIPLEQLRTAFAEKIDDQLILGKIVCLSVSKIDEFEVFVIDYLPEFEHPQDFELGRFFVNGKFVGRGEAGNKSVLHVIKDSKSPPMVLTRHGYYTEEIDIDLRFGGSFLPTEQIERLGASNKGFTIELHWSCKVRNDSRYPN